MKGLKLHTVNSDGTKVKETTVDVEIKDPDTQARVLDEQGQPCVVVTILPCSQSEWRAIMRKHTEKQLNRSTRSMEEVVDDVAAEHELLRTKIVTWRGFVGADDKPLVCNDATKVELDPRVKNTIVNRILGSEVVEAKADSFRQSA